ncbi:hypothetical protein BH23PLA1_BH23PLA1_09450 [soil metagenome]
MRWNHPARWFLVPLLALLINSLPGCGGGQEVTAQAIRDAQRRWIEAGIRDYDLEWISSGHRTGHYFVYVRGGRVRAVHALLPDGRLIKQKPADPEPYGIDGLFGLIEDEMAQLEEERPFGRPKGTKAVLRFTPDPELGYPRSYRRDLLGSRQGVAIDIIRLTPGADSEIPIPSL